MATSGNVSGFSSRPSTSQSFERPSSGYTDLSALAPENPFAPLGESQGAGNTVSTADTGLPGSTSEQSQDEPDRTVTLDQTHGNYRRPVD